MHQVIFQYEFNWLTDWTFCATGYHIASCIYIHCLLLFFITKQAVHVHVHAYIYIHTHIHLRIFIYVYVATIVHACTYVRALYTIHQGKVILLFSPICNLKILATYTQSYFISGKFMVILENLFAKSF